MTVRATSFTIPGGTNLCGGLEGRRLLLRNGEVLGVFDASAGAVTHQRALVGLRSATARGAWVHLQDEEGSWLLRADLSGDCIPSPEARDSTLCGILGSVAVFSNRGAWAVFDLERRAVVGRGTSKGTEWRTLHAQAGVLLGLRGRTRSVVALRVQDGTIAWTTAPFARKLDVIGYPIACGDEVHVRADAGDEALVARLAARDGAVKSVRAAPASLDSWLPDLGFDVDVSAARFDRSRSALAHTDAIVVRQHDQAIIVRGHGVARVALPEPLTDLDVFDGFMAGLLSDHERSALIVVPLPSSGDHDLEIVPTEGAWSLDGALPAEVTFVGKTMPLVVVVHPEYGSVNLKHHRPGAPPALGTKVILDGVEKRPGGVVHVERWWVMGARPSQGTTIVALMPAAMARTADDAPTTFAPSLRKRARAEGFALPVDVLRLVELVDRDPAFRRALARLGFHFDEAESALDVLAALEIEDFLPVWGNGFGDGYGGVTRASALGYLHVKDERVPTALPPLVAHIRDQAAETDEQASAEVVLAVLERGRLG